MNILEPCKEIEISSSGLAKEKMDIAMGTYVRENYLLNGRNVYKHKEHELFVYYINEMDGVWMVRCLYIN